MLRYTTDRARPGLVAFLRHPARKRSGSILTTGALHGAKERNRIEIEITPGIPAKVKQAAD